MSQDAIATWHSGELPLISTDTDSFDFASADFAKLPQKEVTAKDRQGTQTKYAGVLIADLLKQADVALGERLRGKLLANHLLVEAGDKYRVVFSLPEVDPESTDNVVLLAHSRDGMALDAAHGPLQIIVPAEKRQVRWVKNVVRMTVRSDMK